jgi:uncharacterized protein YqhQ
MESIGGQSVIEGVMLRKRYSYSIAVRAPKGNIIAKKFRIKNHRKGFLSFFNLPFFRGIYAMYEMLSIGIKSLVFSGNTAIDDNEEKITMNQMFWMVIFSMLLVIGFFIVLPYSLTILMGVKENTSPVFFNIVDALIKLVFFIAYIVVIGRMKDVQRLFQYHGAEHKVVHCYESGKKVIPINAKKFSFIHSRCGSSFMMLSIFVSVILFTILPLLITFYNPDFFSTNVIYQKSILISLRIIMIPLIIGFAYELIKLTSRYPNNIFLKVITYPGNMLQKLTAAEPNKKQIEVAIAALNKLI